MSFSFLIALFLAHALEPPALGDPPYLSARIVAVLLGVVAMVALAQAIAVWTVGQLRADPQRRATTLRRYGRLSLIHELVSIGLVGIGAYFVNWVGVVRSGFGMRGIWPIEDLLLIAPYLLAEMLSTICFYSTEQTIRQTSAETIFSGSRHWRCRDYLLFQFRGRFGVLLCSTLMLSGFRSFADWAYPTWTESPWMAFGLSCGMALAVLAVAPLILRLVWSARTLPAGPLRDQLEQLSHRLRFRASDILLWNTGNGVSNAAIAGIVPQVRYVLLSDGLLRDLADDEIAAVFGHEVGHVRHRHLLYYLGFILIGSFAAAAIGQLGEVALRLNGPTWLVEWAAPLFDVVPLWLLALAPLWFLGFGVLSRRCERQADLYGARTASQSAAIQLVHANEGSPESAAIAQLGKTPRDPPINPEGAGIFIRALEKVALVNGMSRSSWNWRHGSIAQRVAFLERVVDDPAIADRFDRSLAYFILLITAATLAAGGIAAAVGMHYFPEYFTLV